MEAIYVPWHVFIQLERWLFKHIDLLWYGEGGIVLGDYVIKSEKFSITIDGPYAERFQRK